MFFSQCFIQLQTQLMMYCNKSLILNMHFLKMRLKNYNILVPFYWVQYMNQTDTYISISIWDKQSKTLHHFSEMAFRQVNSFLWSYQGQWGCSLPKALGEVSPLLCMAPTQNMVQLYHWNMSNVWGAAYCSSTLCLLIKDKNIEQADLHCNLL